MRFMVDFNDIYNGDLIEAPLEDADSELPFMSLDLNPGSVARLHDGTGHECSAFVVGVNERNGHQVVEFLLDWPTWTSASSKARSVFSFFWPARTVAYPQ
jgi:hypothetical protein